MSNNRKKTLKKILASEIYAQWGSFDPDDNSYETTFVKEDIEYMEERVDKIISTLIG